MVTQETRKSADQGRGRGSRAPTRIPPAGWRDILLRTKDQVVQDNVSIVAAGLAFYSLLAIFPAIAALVSLYGLLADAADVQRHFAAVATAVPAAAQSLLSDQMSRVAEGDSGTLSLAALASLAIALWGASRGTHAFMIAMNIAYNEKEKRGLVKLNLIAVFLTVCLLLFAAVALVGTVVVPVVFGLLGIQDRETWMIAALRWPLLAVFFMVALAALYRIAPSRRDAKWRWVTPGSILAVVMWITASIGFSLYMRYFASYNETYGSLGAIVGTLMWFWLSAFVVILGAEFNAETEHQTRRDSTTGDPKPMGERGAYVADTVGKKP